MNMEMIKNISSVIGFISASIALIVTIFKPVRTGIANYITHRTNEDRISAQRAEILQKLPEIDRKLDIMTEQNEEIIHRVDKLEGRVLTNEQDRLRSEIYNCGNRCRRHIDLYPEEYTNIRECYEKYVDIGGNHGANLEFDFITQYYNNQNLNG